MLISYNRPEPIVWTIVGTGAEFLTDPEALSNGRPSSGTRIQFVSGTQTSASVVSLRAAWPSADSIIVGLAGLVGTTLPVGLRVVCSVYFGGGWTYNAIEGTVFLRADGVRCVWFYFPVNFLSVPVQGIQFSIYNDVGGVVVPLAAEDPFDIGEIWFGEASQYCIRPEYQSGKDDHSSFKQSIQGQPFPVKRRASSTSSVELTPLIYDAMWPDLGIDYIRSKLLGYAPAVVVPITSKPFTGTAIDPVFVNRHAEFGYAKTVGPIVGEAPRFKWSADFVSPPALLP